MHDLAARKHLFNNGQTHDSPPPKCFFAQTPRPRFDQYSPPLKKQPFATVLKNDYSYSIELLVPERAAKRLKKGPTLFSVPKEEEFRYARVEMKLGEILEGDFFNDYIKTGDIIMRSEGRQHVDTVMSLCHGNLHLEIDKEIYQRTGLQNGVAIPSAGRQHIKTRYAIDIDLRAPAMVRGKKGFERVLWACQNALNQRLAWLFYDLRGDPPATLNLEVTAPPTAPPTAAIERFGPVWHTLEPSTSSLSDVLMPHFPADIPQAEYEDAIDLLEWLTMATSMSPRVQSGDTMDPYLSRYQVPRFCATKDSGDTQALSLLPLASQTLVSFRWRGLIPREFAKKVLLATFAATTGKDDWFGMTTRAFSGDVTTHLIQAKQDFMWSYKD